MEKIIINGGKKLYGNVTIPVAKNSVLPILAASVLCDGIVTVRSVPTLSDTNAAVDILKSLGLHVRYVKNEISVCCGDMVKSKIPYELMQTMRSSIFFAAPILARVGQVEISNPGGCRLGERPIDIHLAGLCAMGAYVQEMPQGKVVITAPQGLMGTNFTLRLPSVGATETLIMAAVTARGKTILQNTAKEPEIADLADFLNACGGKIRGAGSKTIQIIGVPKLEGCSYTPIPDRITAATVMCGVAAVGGCVTLASSRPFHIASLGEALMASGSQIEYRKNSLTITSNGLSSGIGEIKTGTFPTLATDCAPLLAAALLKGNGITEIEDTIFQNRFACADGFLKMGAKVEVVKNKLRINGVNALYGDSLQATDLRGGAALVIAALAGKGTSVVTGCEYINRGYEDIAQLFSSLGADIEKKL